MRSRTEVEQKYFEKLGTEVFLGSERARAALMTVEAGHGEYPDMDMTWFVLCVSGGGRVSQRSAVQELDISCRVGDVCLTPVGPGGSGFWPSGSIFVVGLEQAAVDDVSRAVTGGRDFALEELSARRHRSPLMAAGMRALFEEARAGRLSTALVETYLGAGIAELSRMRLAGKPSQGSIQPLAGPKLRRVRELIEERFREDVSVAELAASVSLSRFHFTRAFQAATGLSPHAFLSRRKMAEAARLLTVDDGSITDVAGALGYDSPSAFSATFRRAHGVTPTEYRIRSRP